MIENKTLVVCRMYCTVFFLTIKVKIFDFCGYSIKSTKCIKKNTILCTLAVHSTVYIIFINFHQIHFFHKFDIVFF